MEHRLARRAQAVGASLIRQMFVYAQTDLTKNGIPQYVSLGVGVPSFALPEYTARELSRAVLEYRDRINKYVLGLGLPELNQAVATKLKSAGIDADPEREILITAGSAGGLSWAFQTLIDIGDDVILPSPAYSNHVDGVKIAGGVPVPVPLIEDDGYRLDVGAIQRAITGKTKAIVFSNPSNPTGAVFPEEDLRAVGEIARRHNLYVLEDNAYAFLTYDGIKHFSLAAVPELRDSVLSFFTASKEDAMTGFRVGWVVTNTFLIEKMFAMQDQFIISPSSISEYGALFAITGPQDHVEYFRQELSRRRDLICSRLDRLEGVFSYIRPQGTYYVFPRLSQTILDSEVKLTGKATERFQEIPEKWRTKDSALALALLYEAGVVTVPGIAFGPQGEDHLRFSFAAEERDINEAFNRIERWLMERALIKF